ncbi:MAG: efflux RND transporter periplasmic adaptor subunit [Pseudoflavonifractor sp.]|nr:efflux RND transporter periplasmic adaptor subunit [Alloprevotella sp.]MCM1116030.1 efflux RND transporter periplasmic adaptor subunit [Pseudoflavonifractor sp.]
MDREIPKEERRKGLRKKMIIYGGAAIVAVGLGVGALSLAGRSVKASSLSMAEATMGRVETSLSASGRVVPAYEQIITSPISSRILEVYVQAGDSLREGEPIMRLDLGTAETELSSLADQRAIKALADDKQALADRTEVADLEMRIKVKEMAVSRLEAELAAERRLDSIGSGTGEKVAQAELAWHTGAMELEQMRRQLESTRSIKSAEGRSRSLDMSVFDKSMAEKQRQLDQARILAPRNAIVTSLVTDLGRQISPGEKLATVADLSTFKVAGEIADTYADRVSPGSPVKVRIGRRETLDGHVTSVNPQSSGGTISFTVALDNPSARSLRSGLRAEVYIITDLLEGAEVVRVPNGPYYTGPGRAEVWVTEAEGKELTRRKVTFGEGGYDFVEVTEGLSPGEKIVTSDMNDYKNNSKLKLK